MNCCVNKRYEWVHSLDICLSKCLMSLGQACFELAFASETWPGWLDIFLYWKCLEHLILYVWGEISTAPALYLSKSLPPVTTPSWYFSHPSLIFVFFQERCGRLKITLQDTNSKVCTIRLPTQLICFRLFFKKRLVYFFIVVCNWNGVTLEAVSFWMWE